MYLRHSLVGSGPGDQVINGRGEARFTLLSRGEFIVPLFSLMN